MGVTNQDRAAIRKLFRKIRMEIRPSVEAEAKRLNHHEPRTLNIMAAQNTLKCCMEVVMNECLPYDQHFLAEMAVRMASYFITAAPIEDHEIMTQGVLQALPNAVAEKVRAGAVINTVWEIGGVETKNVPGKQDIN